MPFGPGPGRRDPRGRSFEDFRAVLHNQGRGRGHRAGAVGLAGYHSGTRRLDDRSEPAGRRRLLSRVSAAGTGNVRGRVLIVDDDPSLCDVIQAGLKHRDFESVSAASADAAMSALARQEFDAVLTDLRMGGMSGLELCRRMTEDHPGVPVIVVTAFGSMDTAVAAIRAGAYDFVTKPVDTDELALILDRAIQFRALH